MSDKLRFGVAGLGRIGWATHCPQLAGHADCELAAVADTDAGRRAEAEEKYHCKSFADYREMISSGLLDAVVIATPTHLHEEMAVSAFQQGLHVILEKPMAPDVDSAERIAAAAVAAGKKLTVYQPHRLFAYFQHIKQIVESGRIGKIINVQRASFSYARRNDWQSLARFGGGMLNNYGAHFLDQILQLIGYDVKKIFCALQLVATLGDADDVVKIVVQTEQGIWADLYISQAAPSRPYEFIVWGTRGTIEMNGSTLKIRSFNPADLPAKELDCGLASQDRKYPNDQLPIVEESVTVNPALAINLYADFAAAVREDREPFVPPRETLALMHILDKCRKFDGMPSDLRE